ncbi:MAG: family 10 glycosylhydrolase [Thermoproteota archaeon]
MSKRSIMLVFPVLVLLLIVASYFLLNRIMRIEEPPKPELRGVFLYMYEFPDRSVSRNFTSYIGKIKSSGFNIVLPFVVHAGGLADYRSKIVPVDMDYLGNFKSDEDPLKIVVEESHRNGLKVWAWVVGFRTSRSVLLQHPDWGIVNEKGEDQLSHGSFHQWGWYYLSPASEGARNYIKSYIVELVQEYGVDGINIEDDFGFPPGIEADFSENARRSFESFLGRKVQNWPQDVLAGGSLRSEWIGWRAQIVTDFLREIRSAVKQINPDIVLSADVSYDSNWNRQAMGVDWSEWVRQGLVDVVCPMLYHRDNSMPVKWVEDTARSIVEQVEKSNSSVLVMPCVGGSLSTTGNMPGWEWVDSVKGAMRAGASGVLVFADVCLDSSRAWVELANYFQPSQ